jgi:hypothetical protein
MVSNFADNLQLKRIQQQAEIALKQFQNPINDKVFQKFKHYFVVLKK